MIYSPEELAALQANGWAGPDAQLPPGMPAPGVAAFAPGISGGAGGTSGPTPNPFLQGSMPAPTPPTSDEAPVRSTTGSVDNLTLTQQAELKSAKDKAEFNNRLARNGGNYIATVNDRTREFNAGMRAPTPEPTTLPDAPTTNAAAAGAAAGAAPDRLRLGLTTGGGAGGGGLAKQLRDAQGHLLNTMDSADQARIGALGDVGNDLQAARDSASNAAWAQQAHTQGAVDRVADINQQQADHRQQVNASMDQFRAQQQEKMDSLKGVDPERWWNSQGTPGKIVNTLAMALGAFGAAVPHSGAAGRNYAQEMINQHIENDIKAQKINLDNEWSKITKGTDLQKDKFARAQWQDELFDKQKHDATDKAKMQIESAYAMAKTDEQKAKLGELYAGLVDKQKGLEVGMEQRRFGVLQQQAAAAASGGNSVAAAKAEYDKMYKAAFAKSYEKGEATPDYESGLKAYLTGKGAAPGGAGASPLAGVPEKDREHVAKDLDKLNEWQGDREKFAALRPSIRDQGWGSGSSVTKQFQGTEGAAAERARQAHNAQVEGIFKRQEGLKGNPEALATFAKPYLIPEGANEQTIASVNALVDRDLLKRPVVNFADAYKKGPQQAAAGPQYTLPPTATPRGR